MHQKLLSGSTYRISGYASVPVFTASVPVREHNKPKLYLEVHRQLSSAQDVSLLDLLARTRDSSARQTITSQATTPTIVARMSLVSAPIADLQRLPMVLHSREPSHEEERSEHEARAVALGRGLREPNNRMVRRSKGGAIEPPMARKTS